MALTAHEQVKKILSRDPGDASQWTHAFTVAERDLWTHRIGDLLLNRARNSAAQNHDFDMKKNKYFTTTSGSAAFAMTTQVLPYDARTPPIIEARQKSRLATLANTWRLN